MKKNKKKKIPYCYNKLFPILLFTATLFMGMGYAVINSISLDIGGIATAEQPDNLFISQIEFGNSKNQDVEKMDTLSTFETTLNCKVTLSSSDPESYVSYIVTVYNNTSDTYSYTGTTYDDAFYDNKNIIYSVTKINNDRFLESHNVDIFEIKFQYKDSTLSSNNILNSFIKFCYSKVFPVEYKNLAGKNLQDYTIDDQDYSVTFTDSIPHSVQVYRGGILSTDYTYDGSVLTVPKTKESITIVGYVAPPELGNDLIPVIHDGNNWIAVDENSEWYDYSKHQWANAVVPKSTVSISPGDIVTLNTDTTGIFVWIPRYEYKIATDGTNEIYINFIPPENTTAHSGYILPDGFTFGGTNASGIWFGKFETSIDTTTEELYVWPNAISVTEKNISTQFNLALTYNDNFTSTNIDSHMTKNSEWGIAAYLTVSLYGKYGNKNYTGTNKEVYVNNSLSLRTGRSGGSPMPSATSDGTYAYDAGFVTGTEESGIGASTTGTIYGIYDMSGGAYEYVMGWYTAASSTFGATSVYNAAGFTETPDAKYYDAYTTNDVISYPYISHALGETSWWNDDISTELSTESPWYMRGGVADGGAVAGIFAVGTTTGYQGAYATFRLTLVVT